MDRKTLAIVSVCVVVVGAAAGVLTWHFWPEPPPTTADQVVATVMVEANPLEMTPEQLDRWVNDVADVVAWLDELDPRIAIRQIVMDPVATGPFADGKASVDRVIDPAHLGTSGLEDVAR